MTIVVGVSTPDGLVLAADSRATFTDGERHRIASDNAQKVFAVGNMGVAAAGSVFIGPHTIAGAMDRFIAQLDKKAYSDFDRFVEELGKFFDDSFNENLKANNESWDPATQGYALNLIAAGYDDDGVGYIRELLIPGPQVGDFQLSTTDSGTMWRGQTDVVGRLLNGVDWAEFETTGEPPPEELAKRLQSLAYNALSPIAVQDAVDYATFLIRTTIDMQRFSDGTVAHPGLVPGCGGPVLALVIERNTIRWASDSTRPHWEQVTQR